MGDWPIIYPKRQLNPDFRDAVRLSMANAHKAKWQRLRGEEQTVSGYSGPVLTLLAGFTHQSELSRVLHVERLAASPRTVHRLRKLADAIGFTGHLFAAEDVTDEQAEGASL